MSYRKMGNDMIAKSIVIDWLTSRISCNYVNEKKSARAS